MSDSITLENVLEFFPNIDVSFVNELYESLQSYSEVFNHLISLNGEYRKTPRKTRATISFSSTSLPSPSSLSLPKIDFKDTTSVIPKAARIVICKIIVNEFDMIDVSFLIRNLKEQNFHLFPTFKKLFIPYQKLALKADPDDKDDVYEIKLNPLLSHILSLENTPRAFKEGEEEAGFRALPSLKEEITFMNEKKSKYLKKFERIRGLNDERKNTLEFCRSEMGQVDGIMYECSVCAQFLLEREMIKCRNQTTTHLVCCYCFKEVVKGNLNNGCSNIDCMADNNCTAGYGENTVRNNLNRRLFGRYEEMCAINDVLKADNPNMRRCPFCRYAVEIDAGARITELACGNRLCGIKSCLLCNKAVSTHGDGECPMVLKERETQSYKDLASDFTVFVASAIDKEFIRECHRCKHKVVKDKGCNHIRCKCGFNFCYICRKPMEVQDNPSDHFKPDACPQYSSQEEDDFLLREKAIETAKFDWYAKHPDALHVKLVI